MPSDTLVVGTFSQYFFEALIPVEVLYTTEAESDDLDARSPGGVGDVVFPKPC